MTTPQPPPSPVAREEMAEALAAFDEEAARAEALRLFPDVPGSLQREIMEQRRWGWTFHARTAWERERALTKERDEAVALLRRARHFCDGHAGAIGAKECADAIDAFLAPAPEPAAPTYTAEERGLREALAEYDKHKDELGLDGLAALFAVKDAARALVAAGKGGEVEK